MVINTTRVGLAAMAVCFLPTLFAILITAVQVVLHLTFGNPYVGLDGDTALLCAICAALGSMAGIIALAAYTP